MLKVFMRQKTLFKLKDYGSEFGGSLLKGQRKIARPLSTKSPIKIVLKADSTSSPQLTRFRNDVDNLFKRFSIQFQVKIYKVAICGDHVHFVGLFQSKMNYTKFIRALTGTMARKLSIKFKFRPWSRILHWGRAFKIALKYTFQNHLESIGAIPYQPRPKDIIRSKKLLRYYEKA